MDIVFNNIESIYIQIFLVIIDKKFTDMSLSSPPLVYLYSNIEFELPKGKCQRLIFSIFFLLKISCTFVLHILSFFKSV